LIEAEVSGTVLLTLALKDGSTGESPLATVKDSAGVPIAGSPFALTDEGSGLYQAVFAAPAEGDYSVLFETSGFETVSEQLRVRDPIDEQVWGATLASFIDPGSTGEALIIAGGQGGLNARVDALAYDANDRPTSFRVRIFPDATTAGASTAGGTGEGEIVTLTETGTWIDAVKWQSLLRVR